MKDRDQREGRHTVTSVSHSIRLQGASCSLHTLFGLDLVHCTVRGDWNCLALSLVESHADWV